MRPVLLALVVGLLLSPLAGLAAFLITFDEYRHHFPSRREAREHAVRTALLTFLFFLVASIVAVGIVSLVAQ